MRPIYIRPVDSLEKAHYETCRRHPILLAVYWVSTRDKNDRRRGIAYACTACADRYRKYGLAKNWPKEKVGVR